MSSLDWWLLLLVLFNSHVRSFGSGELDSCRLRFDEFSTVRPESTVHGPPSTDHSYYFSLKFEYCEEKDRPSLTGYTVAIVRLAGADNVPRQIAFFDLQNHSPVMKNNGKYISHRTTFGEVYGRMFIGNFHDGETTNGLLANWKSTYDAKTSVIRPLRERLDPEGDDFVSVYLLMYFDKSDSDNRRSIQRFLSVLMRDSTSHRTSINPFILSSEFNTDWATIASATVQAVSLTTSHSRIGASSILKGLKGAVDDFTVLMIPDMGGKLLDIPKGRAVRVCSERWVLTKQSVDAAHSAHCDENKFNLENLIVVPSTFNWDSDYIHEEPMDVSHEGEDENSNDRTSEGSRSPSPKRGRMDEHDVLVFYGGLPHIAVAPAHRHYLLMINYHHQVSVSRLCFSDSGEIGRLRPLSKRELYVYVRYFNDIREGGLIRGISFTMDRCFRLFDLYSFVIMGSTIRANDIESYVLRTIGKTRSDVLQLWNENTELDGMTLPCGNLFTQLASSLPFHLGISFSRSNGAPYLQSILSKFGNQDATAMPTIYIDADNMLLYDYVNGMTDIEIDRIQPYLTAEDPRFQGGSKPDGGASESVEPENSGAGYCGRGDQSELLRLARDTHDMLIRISEGATSFAEKQYIERKLREFRRQHSFLLNLEEKPDDMREIIDSNLLSEETLEGLLSNSRLTYIDMAFDKAQKKLRIWCNACQANGLSNVKHRRSVEWEISETSITTTKSTLDTIRNHHLTNHHMDSVRMIESKAEANFRDEFKSHSAASNSKPSTTAIMIKAVYYSAKLAIPGFRFSDICQLLRDSGVPLGNRNTCRTSYMRVLELLHDVMRKRIRLHLTSERIPFSIMLDTSTDSQGRTILIILLSAIVDDHPREFFYAAIELDGETGASIYNAVIAKFEKDGMLSYLDDRLIGISTDGSPNMIGDKELGFGGRMRRRLEEHRKKNAPERGIPTSIPHIHCAGHRIELALRDAFKALARENEKEHGWSETTSTVINFAANFFSKVAPRRRESLRKTVEEQRMSGSLDKFLNPGRNYEIRWTPSGLSARKTLARMIKPMWDNLLEYNEDLKKMTSSNDADRNLAFKAKSLLMVFQNIRFYSHLTFEIGFLECIAFLELEAQRADGNLIDFPIAFEESKKCIREFYKNPFEPYHPSIRDSTDKTAKQTDVAFMRNVYVTESTGLVPIKDSADGRRAIFGDTSAALDSLRFRLDFTTKSRQGGANAAKDTYFTPINPLPSRRVGTSDSMRAAYETERQRELAEARQELDAEKAGQSLMTKKVEAAQFELLDLEKRTNYGEKIIHFLEVKFDDQTLQWAASFSVRSLIYGPLFNKEGEVKEKENRKHLCDLFHLDANKVENDIERLRSGFTTQLTAEKRKQLEDSQTDIVLFHMALRGKDCYGQELEDIISLIITLPINSAGVERSFSVFNNFMNKRRSSLTIPHLEAFLFLHQNGPDPHSFNPDAYEHEWLQKRDKTEILQSQEKEKNGDVDENEDNEPSFWNNAFSNKKKVPRITIFD